MDGVNMKFNIMNLVAGVIAVLTMIGAVIGADSRYVKSDDLTLAKNEDKVPRFLIEKHKQITRQIEDLQDVDRKKEDKK